MTFPEQSQLSNDANSYDTMFTIFPILTSSSGLGVGDEIIPIFSLMK